MLRTSEQDGSLLGNAEQGLAVDAAARLASEIFDEAVTDRLVRLTNKEVADLCGVSQSLVEKWRKPEQRECPSYVQLLRLPLSFHLARHRAENRRFGFGRAALARLLEAAGDLAAVTG